MGRKASRLRRRRQPPAGISPTTSPSPSPTPASSSREFAMTQSPSKLSDPSVSTPPGVLGHQGWADLPDKLLHSIVPLLGSFLDLIAFASTCCSWRAAFSSYPSKPTICTKLPPLLVRPNVCVDAPHLPSSNGRHKLRTCKVIDLTNQNRALRCQIPQETFQRMRFAGSSYGHLICCRRGNCLVVDVFTGAEVSPPSLPFSGDCEQEVYFGGTLTAPLASPNCHLLVSTRSSLFDWPVGSDSWSELKLSDARVDQIVEFNGQFIAMDYSQRIYILKLAPQLGLQEITTEWWDDMTECPYLRPWLVVCGDMLLMVDHYMSLSFGAPVLYKPYHLDMSTRPAKWVEVKKLDNWALFVGGDVRSPPFSCLSPEKWGGRSNCLYYAHYSQPWSVHGLGDAADAVWDPSTDPDLVYKRNWYGQLQAFWVYPSMFYSDAPVVTGHQDWADLPDNLLHSIVPLLGSFLDLIAFASTCRSWRAAFSSYPSKSTFCTKLPPLLVRPNVRVQAPHLPSSNGRHKLRTCKVIDLANQNIALRCQIPHETFQRMRFAGSSYGQLICCRRGNCLIVDVFTGAEVSPPCLPFSGDCEEEFYFGGTLTAPLASPNCQLLVSTRSSLFDWPVGSDSWSEIKLSDARIDQIVEFNGQFIAMDYSQRIYVLKLAPQLGLQEITTKWWDGMTECPYLRPWLVVCGDMLLMVDHYVSLSFGAPVLYKPYRLDMSTRPAKWVEVKKLDNWALFVGGDVRSPPFSCLSPEKWGGTSNRLYYAHYSQPWSVHGFGDAADAVWDPSTDPDLVYKRNWYGQLQAFWVYPSMFYSDGQ
ncbi:hypothetical protein CFC21_110643 [Triticum aestivum]|uniref:F-box domain-containing protein n=3 Tax=Triticum aestivum TaxID=4565 RepID=A0A9R1MNE2_WHEAT|nr:uncharacterized protein LOC123167970 isoform X1 [Triticum aestivum]KAF7110555.1 hypothetical protein CFC21_110643 [Triticum aestivum]